MDKKVTIAILGAGTAGLSAYKEARKQTKDILVIDKGPIGSTCARVGCMPSKLLIHIANQFYNRIDFNHLGIHGTEHLRINIPQALAYVRKMRDEFTAAVVKYTESLGDHFMCGAAKFIDSKTLIVGKQKIIADKIIIATGSSSIIPDNWQVNHSTLLTSENFFEQENLAQDIGIIGGGILGLELGQALNRLGIHGSLYHGDNFLGGLTDPKVNAVAIEILKTEFPIHLNEQVTVSQTKNTSYRIETPTIKHTKSSVLAAVGRKPNLNNLDLEKLDLELDEPGIPKYDAATMQVKNHPIYIAGDVNKLRPLLHEAADEGRIAGFNAANSNGVNQCFKRRTPIRIVFSQPNIAVVGLSFHELSQTDYVIGEATYDNQGRAKIEDNNRGILRVYGTRDKGLLLGAECIAPGAEHLAHLLAWAIQKEMDVFEMLQMPFYHPVIEEGMRTALRDLSKKVKSKTKSFDLVMCDSEAISPLS